MNEVKYKVDDDKSKVRKEYEIKKNKKIRSVGKEYERDFEEYMPSIIYKKTK